VTDPTTLADAAHGGTIAIDGVVDEFTEFVGTPPRRMFAGEGGRV
jgi:hypothetical protein